MFAKKPFRPAHEDDTGEVISRAESISYLPLDEATAVPRPDTISSGWHEHEFDGLGAEQKRLWAAEGEKEARKAKIRGAAERVRRDTAVHQVEVQKDELAKAKADLDLHEEALAGYTRREPHAKTMYLLRWALLLLGDIAGIAGAAILLGEIPSLALLQAVASAVAAVTAGLAGNDIRDARLARRRARDTKDLPPQHQRFAWIFNGGDTGERIVKAIVLAGITITVLIIGGIFALRAGVEGSLGGIVFGCLAGAICLASVLNTYQYADEVADLLDRAYHRYIRASNRLRTLAGAPAIARYESAAAEAASITAEHSERGTAGQLKLTALKHGVSRANPAVMGHGPAPRSSFREPDLLTLLESADGQNGNHDIAARTNGAAS
ncbi:hypothetical protein KIH31_15280 [Paenarthrobacter sp. DKR-5]|uniref:hypothetical protein n=1 Tax=Paenarthrobacter sp. DKR-5 TaxID=2835535 RepID=UPI001BDC7F93|nr:hypothetical protein [Paenarthrobacter sp. DKR-5]MBT1003952.1 hypothetical protein [Paenarthrobacter sp. DKR-5]